MVSTATKEFTERYMNRKYRAAKQNETQFTNDEKGKEDKGKKYNANSEHRV